MGQQIKNMAGAANYVMDSFPIAACENIRIKRSRILKGKIWHVKQASMARYFYGKMLKKVHAVTQQGFLIKVALFVIAFAFAKVTPN